MALVAGGGSGIGRSTATMLAAEGARVVVMGRRIEPLEVVASQIRAAGDEAWAREADLQSREQLQELVRWIEASGCATLWTLVQRGRERCFKVILDDHGSTRVEGFIVSQSSTFAVKRRALSMPASIAGVGNAAPKAVRIDFSTAQACPRQRASLATNDRRGGQAVFGATAVVLHRSGHGITCFLETGRPSRP